MSVLENLAIGGCIGAAVGVSAFFIREGNKLRKDGQRKDGTIVMTCGSIVGAFAITNLVFALRK